MSTLRYGRRVSLRLLNRRCAPYRPRSRLRTRNQKRVHRTQCHGSVCRPDRGWRNLHLWEHQMAMGRVYGMPECCIRHFVFGRKNRLRPARFWRVHGYVLCPKCLRNPIVKRLLP